MKKIFYLLLIALLSLSLFSCDKNTLEVTDCGVIHELEFGGVYITITIDDFNQKGFAYGDSVNVKFTNNYEVNDIPYYNGYYVDAGETLLVGYPGYDYVKLTLNYGDDYWFIAKLNEDDKATISLNQKEKYKDIQETMNIQYKDERSYYDSDVIFANYRAMNVGNLKDNLVYRSASPCDNKHNRASCVDTLMKQDQINYIINLADTKEKVDAYIAKDDFNSPYFLELYDTNVILLAMNMNYKSDEFRGKVTNGFKQMLSNDGPYLIHCQEGKDRTGFVCIVLEALCGATYQELVDDYMLTYDNYYKITETRDPLRYRVIKERNVDSMLRFLVGDENAKLDNMNFVPYMKNYLKNGGMTEAEVNQLVTKLSK